MDLWQKARSFAEEAAKRSQEITKEAISAAKRSPELTRGAARISDIVSETAKKSKEIAAEATKKADQIKIEALKRADQIKSLAEGISPQIPATVISLIDSSAASSSSDLEKFGVTQELREFVKGITINTFQDFPIEDEPEIPDVPTVSNVRKDLTEWQERHATLVLSTVKEISRLRYQLCPRHMKERKFWRIYFILVSSHVTPYEKRYMEELKLKEAEQPKDNKVEETLKVGTEPRSEMVQTNQKNKTSTSTAEDLDAFLLGDLGSSDEAPDDGDDRDFDDDFDKVVENMDADEK
ncbi:PREDICTED: uncharacterized protein LOC104597864 [Nelumbo nucifera]|uniref:Uncharacterized protein LOC104597864 n=1 Tax=Nelumbo nucifera TaxID=4432 RepID=A0A1U8A7L5_NELNU|nr:PREDICTED: uncharacterized protein LOC104597864 [Nelumbo nucifera]